MSRASGGWPAGLICLALLPLPALAQEVKTGAGIGITVHGIIGATYYAQDATFGLGNGQKAEFATAELRNASGSRKWVHGGDVRNARLTLLLAGPEISRNGKWRANATLEMDFFGSFPGATAATSGGAFGDEQPQPRLRLAFADITNGRTTLRVGQDWSLTLGNIPVSASHIGFPLGWGSGGFIGWRFTQVRLIQVLSAADAPTTARLQLAALKGSWSDEPAGADDQFSGGERTLAPQVEGRFDFMGKAGKGTWGLYFVGHVDKKDSVLAGGADLTSWATEAGGSVVSGRWSLYGNGHVGKGMAHQFAQILQFGDIKGWGAWGQVGVNLNSSWSLWGYGGYEKPKADDVRATFPTTNGRLHSLLLVPMLRYRSGPYTLGLEWLHSRVLNELAGVQTTVSGNQVALSTRFDF